MITSGSKAFYTPTAAMPKERSLSLTCLYTLSFGQCMFNDLICHLILEGLEDVELMSRLSVESCGMDKSGSWLTNKSSQ